MASLSRSPRSASASAHSSPQVSNPQDASPGGRHLGDEQSITRSLRSLKIDDKGGITYHGATSFFNLPSERSVPVASDFLALTASSSSSDADNQRRERLINNAWHQRALENLSEIPVCTLMIIEVPGAPILG